MQGFIKEIAKNGKVLAKKSLGQNFLINLPVIEKIIEACEIKPETNIVEIGCGLGSLTWRILEKTSNFIGIEKDSTLVEILKNNFPDANFLCGDALKLDWKEIDCDVIVSNLPYNVGTKILMEIAVNSPAKCFVVMLQKDVISKIMAMPQTKDIHQLGVFFQSFCKLEIICTVPSSAFSPAPEVVSQVLKITPQKHSINLKNFWAFLQKASEQKRKTFGNIFEEVGEFSSRRFESLSLQEFIELSRIVQ